MFGVEALDCMDNVAHACITDLGLLLWLAMAKRYYYKFAKAGVTHWMSFYYH